MNIERLVLAAHVRQIAVELRDDARGRAEAAQAKGKGQEPPSFNAFRWDDEHPLLEFIPRAITELQDAATVIAAFPGQAT